jgi:RNA polymerase sigma factor (sigma-70 family)
MPSSLFTRGSLLARLHDEPGNDATWAEFVRIYGEAVIGWCLASGLQEADASDVAQEVLVRFWKQAGTFRYDPSQRFRGYLRRIVTSALSDRSSRKHTERPVAGSGEFQQLFSSLGAREDLVSRIEAAYDMELFELATREVQSRIQPQTWEAFRMLALEQRPGKEVAAQLGISVGSAYMARSNVQKMIQETLQQLEGGASHESLL